MYTAGTGIVNIAYRAVYREFSLFTATLPSENADETPTLVDLWQLSGRM